MSNQHFEHILEQNIERFVNDFKIWSRLVYTNNSDENEKLLHPGEFGSYRERICRDLLLNFIPAYLDIGSGFVINSENYTSNQGDIVVYDKENIPLIRNIDNQRFFPIENIIAIGEIKSQLSKSVFEEALRRLSDVKKKRIELKNPYIEQRADVVANWNFRTGSRADYNAKINHQDQIVTFIICEKMNFDFMNFNFSDFYKDDHPSTKINMILSLEDGAFMYKSSDGRLHPYPICHNETEGFYLCRQNDSDLFLPIKAFLNNFFVATQCCTRLSSEISQYMTLDRFDSIPLK